MNKWNVFLGVSAVLLSASMSQAALSVTVQTETIQGSTTTTTSGFFDVFLGVTGSGNGSLAGYDVGVNLDTSPGQPTGLSLGTPTRTDVSSPSRTQVFTSANTMLFGAETATGTRVLVDSTAATPVSLDGPPSLDGAGLVRIPFTVAAGASGVFHLNLDVSNDVDGTVLDDSNFNEILPSPPAQTGFTPVNGTITVTLPEPASMSLLALTCGGLLMRRRSVC